MKPTNQPPDLKDDDIRALLDARPPAHSPADLDARILAAAKTEVDATTVNTTTTTMRTTRYGSWMAVAAVCILAVILVPVMQRFHEVGQATAPMANAYNDAAVPVSAVVATDVAGTVEETAAAEDLAQSDQAQSSQAQREQIEGDLTQSDLSEADSMAITARPAAQSTPEQAVLKETARRKLGISAEQKISENTKAELEISVNATAKARAEQARNSAVSAESELILREIDAMTEDEIRLTFESHPYRQGRESWLAEIKRLERLNETAEVVREKRLFERMHLEVK